jgi:drug/metabolite transporter (DMT)-like permease
MLRTMKPLTLLQRAPAALIGTLFVVLWCTGYPAAKIGLGHAAPFTLLTLRFGGAALIYVGLSLAAGVAWPRGRAALHSAVVGALQLALQFGALYFAVARGVNVGMVALIIGTMPIVTALLGLGLGESVRPLQWAGFALGFTGVALAVAEGIGPAHDAGIGAYLAVIVGLFAISVGTLYQKRLGVQVDLRSGLAVQNLVASALLLPLAVLEGWRFDGSAPLWASLGWMIAVNSVSAFALLFVLLKRGAVNEVATLFFLMPPVTALMDYLVLGDPLSALKIAGIAVAALGVYLATRPARSAPVSVSARPAAVRRSCPTPCEQRGA